MGIIIVSFRQNRGFFTHPKRILFLFIALVLLSSLYMVEIRSVLASEKSGVRQVVAVEENIIEKKSTIEISGLEFSPDDYSAVKLNSLPADFQKKTESGLIFE